MRLGKTLVLLLLFVCLTTPAFAAGAPASEAGQVLRATISKVLDELDDPALHDPGARDQVLHRIEVIIGGLFDFRELSSRTVGPAWRSFTPDQQERFVAAFTTLLREAYLEKLDGYNGEKVAYTGEEASSKGDKVEIQTTVEIRNKQVPVAYRMLKKQQWMVYDVVIEGVSMVQNYRTQFQDLLAKGDAEALIKQVNIKAEEVRAYNKKQQTSVK